jgi:acetyltransferase-like isoleucine patch superfamily enzyme
MDSVVQRFVNDVKRLLFEQPKIVGDKSRLHIHEGVVLDGWTTLNCQAGHIHIGESSFVGQNCMFLAGGYGHDISKRMGERKALSKDQEQNIIIGKGVFICSGAIILGPCTIGDHAVIGAGSVVTAGEYEGGCIYAGNPAVFKKRITFTE